MSMFLMEAWLLQRNLVFRIYQLVLEVGVLILLALHVDRGLYVVT